MSDTRSVWLDGIELPKYTHDRVTLPEKDKVFRALDYFEPKDTKVIIVGQDPYPNSEDACGLAFSVEHAAIPPSLRNIFLELFEDTGAMPPDTGNLEAWAKQGVLLLNRVLTVRAGRSDSHSSVGWQEVTDALIRKAIRATEGKVVLILWGRKAQEIYFSMNANGTLDYKGQFPLISMGGHPSPLNTTVPFRGGRYFSRANLFLSRYGITPIDWRLK